MDMALAAKAMGLELFSPDEERSAVVTAILTPEGVDARELVLALPLAGETRPFTPTSIVEPGAPAVARALANSLSRITLDDAVSLLTLPRTLEGTNGEEIVVSNGRYGPFLQLGHAAVDAGESEHYHPARAHRWPRREQRAAQPARRLPVLRRRRRQEDPLAVRG